MKKILVDRSALFSINPEEGFKQRKSLDKFNVLKKNFANGDIQYITFVKQLSLIGGKNLADTIKNILLLLPTDTILSEYSMNCLKKKKKFKELTSLCYAVTEAALKSNKNLIKMDTIQLIGKVIKHSSDQIKRTSTNMDFDQ
ncbi:uncharacterized protein LOC136095263 [Hydra vulgaris]|uniref:uncharacterized protein LOC136095263 n=1 Tax=Hydra vulgaris TaxID=6087 RepID=UPI0032EA62D2